MSRIESGRFQFHRLRHELGNYSLLRMRHCDGVIASMHQSGTHWLKFMLASAMAEHFALPGPQYNHANDIIGGAKDTPTYPQLPELRSSHTIPPLLVANGLGAKLITLPPCVVLVRDIRASLVSNYNKWRERYAVPFSEYLRGDPSGHRFNSDIWWCIRFVNAWARMQTLNPARVKIVRYEALVQDPFQSLQGIADHLGLSLSDASLEAGVRAATKNAMSKRSDPDRPPGEINQGEDHAFAAYDGADRLFFSASSRTYLHNSLGYDYALWAVP